MSISLFWTQTEKLEMGKLSFIHLYRNKAGHFLITNIEVPDFQIKPQKYPKREHVFGTMVFHLFREVQNMPRCTAAAPTTHNIINKKTQRQAKKKNWKLKNTQPCSANGFPDRTHVHMMRTRTEAQAGAADMQSAAAVSFTSGPSLFIHD